MNTTAETTKTINVYADESRHLDPSDSRMVIGGVWTEREYVKKFSDKIKLIKRKHGIPAKREIKWTKVSEAKRDYYLDLIRLFFDDENRRNRKPCV